MRANVYNAFMNDEGLTIYDLENSNNQIIIVHLKDSLSNEYQIGLYDEEHVYFKRVVDILPKNKILYPRIIYEQ